MNKAITDGIVFMPLPFMAGLGLWSDGDGMPGSDTYADGGAGVFVASDPDFGGCLELQKNHPTQKLRYMGETPLLAGCYLRITARVKAVAGPLPNVRISGWAGAAGGGEVKVASHSGPITTLDTYGEVVTIQAIVGSGDRTGVDLVWPRVAYGHFGINLTGPSGGVVRVDDIQIEDITTAFHRKLMAMVDVRDYGAMGDGVTDDTIAFMAADAAADGREVLVPDGIFRLERSVTIKSRIRFQGTLSQPRAECLILQNDFGYQTYLDAFGDEEQAFRKAYQAMLNFPDHHTLDLCGRCISLNEPMNMQRCDPNQSTFEARRTIRNGQFRPVAGPNWDSDTVTSQATYDINAATTLTDVTNVVNIEVGAIVTAPGVGREVYVTARNVGAQTLKISRPLYDAQGTQDFTFQRHKYLLDFSGYDTLSQLVLDDIDFQCEGAASAILLAPDGAAFHLRDCCIAHPKNRGISSPGFGCQGMMIDRCQFTSNEADRRVQDRQTIGVNTNANDVKIRNNRASKFKHFCVLTGAGTVLSGNHWSQGDTEIGGVRCGGVVITKPDCNSVITGNHIDNNAIEWTNEHQAAPENDAQSSFGGLSITGNVLTTTDVGAGTSYIVVKPYGAGHFIQGLSVTGNVFRSRRGNIKRIEAVDTSFADLDGTRMARIDFAANTFDGVDEPCQNPAYLQHFESTASDIWTVDTGPHLPFRGRARRVEAVLPEGPLRDGAGSIAFCAPFAEVEQGRCGRQLQLHWESPVRGAVRYTVRMDDPS